MALDPAHRLIPISLCVISKWPWQNLTGHRECHRSKYRWRHDHIAHSSANHHVKTYQAKHAGV